MTQKNYILFIVIIYSTLIASYFLFDYLAFWDTGDDIIKIFKNMDYISNILNIKEILINILFFVLFLGVMNRLRKLKMRFLWGIIMFIPGLNFVFAIILAFIKDKNNIL